MLVGVVAVGGCWGLWMGSLMRGCSRVRCLGLWLLWRLLCALCVVWLMLCVKMGTIGNYWTIYSLLQYAYTYKYNTPPSSNPFLIS